MPTETAVPVAATFATREQYIAILDARGLAWKEQSGFLKVTAPGGKMYVAATKTVRRIDLGGFEMPLSEELTKLPHCGVFGAIKQQMVVGTGPAGDLERFEEVLTHLLALPAPTPIVKAPKAKKVAGEKKGWGAKAPAAEPESDTVRAARIALIRRVAMEKGMAVSAAADKE